MSSIRENYIAFVVRERDGRPQVLLYEQTGIGGEMIYDVPRNRVRHGRRAEDVIPADLERTLGLKGARIRAVLGDEPFLESRRRTAYLVDAPPGVPDRIEHVIESDGFKITARAAWRDLASPIALMEGASWLQSVREAVRVVALDFYRLVIWRWRGDGTTANPREVLVAAEAGDPPETLHPLDAEALREGFRQLPGYTADLKDPRVFSIDFVPVERPRVAIVRFAPDVNDLETRRGFFIAQAVYRDACVYDPQVGQLYPPGHLPAPDNANLATGRVLCELAFDAPLLTELARLAGPLMAWPLSPPVDEAGNVHEWLDEDLPLRLWTTPENQRRLIECDPIVTGFFFSNDGVILPADADTAALQELDEQRFTREPGGATVIYPYAMARGWLETVEQLGWAYLPNGPDCLWGDLYVGSRCVGLLDNVREWCRVTGRRWVEVRDVEGEARRVTMNLSPHRDG